MALKIGTILNSRGKAPRSFFKAALRKTLEPGLKIASSLSEDPSMKIELYYRTDCPYSKRVRDFISANHLNKIKYHDIEKEHASMDKLMAMTDDEQVPCLVVDGKPILESQAIIEWLDQNSEVLH
jgi:glutaredoxin